MISNSVRAQIIRSILQNPKLVVAGGGILPTELDTWYSALAPKRDSTYDAAFAASVEDGKFRSGVLVYRFDDGQAMVLRTGDGYITIIIRNPQSGQEAPRPGMTRMLGEAEISVFGPAARYSPPNPFAPRGFGPVPHPEFLPPVKPEYTVECDPAVAARITNVWNLLNSFAVAEMIVVLEHFVPKDIIEPLMIQYVVDDVLMEHFRTRHGGVAEHLIVAGPVSKAALPDLSKFKGVFNKQLDTMLDNALELLGGAKDIGQLHQELTTEAMSVLIHTGTIAMIRISDGLLADIAAGKYESGLSVIDLRTLHSINECVSNGEDDGNGDGYHLLNWESHHLRARELLRIRNAMKMHTLPVPKAPRKRKVS